MGHAATGGPRVWSQGPLVRGWGHGWEGVERGVSKSQGCEHGKNGHVALVGGPRGSWNAALVGVAEVERFGGGWGSLKWRGMEVVEMVVMVTGGCEGVHLQL